MSFSPSAGSGRPVVLAPHAPLPHYYGSEDEHRAFVRRMFDDTAPDYERIERVLAFGSGSAYRRRALLRAGLARGARVLDVGIGTGLVAREALRIIGPEGHLVGIDPSPGMMKHVHAAEIELVQGVAEALPQPDASCEFLSLGYALRHIGDLAAAFSEFHRVLRPGGRLTILEITAPRGRFAKAMLKTYMRRLVPLLARLLGGQRNTAELWRYYWDTIEACITPQQVIDALRAAGFAEVRRHVEVGIFSEYIARKPE